MEVKVDHEGYALAACRDLRTGLRPRRGITAARALCIRESAAPGARVLRRRTRERSACPSESSNRSPYRLKNLCDPRSQRIPIISA